MSRTRQLHAASLPFVTRALRGGRKLRYTAVALLLMLLSVLLGTWLALGDGPLEHELRVGFKLERHRHVQEQLEYKIFAHDEFDLRELQAAARQLGDDQALARIARDEFNPEVYAEHRVHDRIRDAFDTLSRAGTISVPATDPALPADIDALLARHNLPRHIYARGYTGWNDAETAEQLRHIVAADLHPAVVLYSSPLTASDALGVIGLVAGAMTMLLLMLFAPVLAGTQMAQEVHDNTLQPLTGTALSARDLVLGLTLGPAAVIALFAAPQIILLLAAALAVGHVLPALGMLAVSLVGGAFLTALAQLVGLALGRQRNASMLGVALVAVLTPLTMIGAVLAIELPSRALGVLALLPQAAASHLLMEGFVPAGESLRAVGVGAHTLGEILFAVTLGTLGMLCFAWLGLKALERRVGELAPSALSRGEALLGAIVSSLLVTIANPWNSHRSYDPGEFYLLNLGVTLVPMAILLMMRVPQQETPTAMRRVPVGSLLAEFAVGVAAFFAISVACMGPEHLHVLRSPIAFAYLLWTIAVAGLLAIRVAALPMSLLAKLWAGVCMIGVLVSFVHSAEWAHHPHSAATKIFGFTAVSPVLGALQALLLVLIPVLLLRALKRPASTTPAAD
jgi:hypothetical protein